MMREIAEHILAELDAGRDTVLVSVVCSSGSTPRHVGAQMLVGRDGLLCGTIGGGKVEAHGIDQACALVGQPMWRMEHVALKLKGDKSLGMVCGGEARLLLAPIPADSAMWREVAEGLMRCFDRRTQAHLALRCPEEEAPFQGAVALIGAGGEHIAGDCSLRPAVDAASMRGALTDGCFVMPVELPMRAIVFGGGHVGAATVATLARVGFECTVFECRPEFARPEVHPDAHRVILGDYRDIRASLDLDDHDCVLIMTHGHVFDFAVLEQALRQPPSYVGLMASRRKIATARDLMLKAGIPQEAFERVHTPIGLDIKAETPAEIAVSIAAQLILHRASVRE